ncbi:hypothetical protein ACFP1H_08740, partial [Secundilactobacillus hailunensis]
KTVGTFTANKGAKGDAGAQGIQGVAGKDGSTPTIDPSKTTTGTDANGNPTTTYHFMITGPDGKPADGGSLTVTDGKNGTNGDTPKIDPSKTTTDKDGNQVYTLVDSKGNSLGTLTAPKGDTGATGATGAQGAQGAKGDTGAAGKDGSTPTIDSKQTTTDKDGNTIYVLVDGAGKTVGTFTANKGAKGDTGAQGIQGVAGKDGSTPTIDPSKTTTGTDANGNPTTTYHFMITGPDGKPTDGGSLTVTDGKNGTNGDTP